MKITAFFSGYERASEKVRGGISIYLNIVTFVVQYNCKAYHNIDFVTLKVDLAFLTS